MEFKKGQGKVERDRERVSEPEKRTKGGETFRETPRRYKDRETEAEVLREILERDSRGGAQKPPELEQELERHSTG